MESNYINKLIEAYYKGETTPEEELTLFRYFAEDDVPDELQEEKILFQSLNQKVNIVFPDDLDKRINVLIDSLAESEVPQKKKRSYLRLIMIGSSIAAACFVLFFYMDLPKSNGNATDIAECREEVKPQDTFSKPEDAYKAAEDAIMLVSSNMNKGLSQLSVVSANLNGDNKHTNNKKKVNI